jgi:hypothetical protein
LAAAEILPKLAIALLPFALVLDPEIDMETPAPSHFGAGLMELWCRLEHLLVILHQLVVATGVVLNIQIDDEDVCRWFNCNAKG